MKSHLQVILQGETEMGDFISKNFQSFSEWNLQDKATEQIRNDLKQFLDALNAERRRLINMEIELYNSF